MRMRYREFHGNLRRAFGTDNPTANWHPLTWISHMLHANRREGPPAAAMPWPARPTLAGQL
jgi:hypothetical protein